MPLALMALLPWLGAGVLALLPAQARRTAVAVAGLVALGVLGLALMQVAPVMAGMVPRWSVAWMPSLGLNLGLRLDGLAWLFVLLIAGVGSLVVFYAAWYLDWEDHAPRFLAFLLLFMGAMVGVVLADNLLLLVMFWELTSLASFLLVGFWHEREDARAGAHMALVVTGAGGLCLLGGVLLIGHMAGSLSLDAVLAAGDRIRAHPAYGAALGLVLMGVFTKSAQVPFHFWLPHAMSAPTPASAFLHSATMVKAGLFLLARLYPALGGTEAWFWVLTLAGALTLLVGAYGAIFQHDLKGLLAYSTLSHLGLITLLFGLDEPLSVVAGLFHLINHAIFKAGLFMAAGIIDHACGTRDMRRINGLWRSMPMTAALGITAAASMAGVPLLNGFLSKEMFFAETLNRVGHAPASVLLPLVAVLAGVLGVAYSLRFVHDVFFNGEPVNLPQQPHEAPWPMLLPVGLLVALCLAVGIVPQWTAGPVLEVAARAALQGQPPAYSLALWHGFNGPLLMSAVALVLGVGLYAGLQRFINLHRLLRVPGWLRWGGREVFQAIQAAVLGASRALTARLQSRRLQDGVATLLALTLAAGAWPFWSARTGSPSPQASPLGGMDPTPVDGATVGIAVLGMAAAVATVIVHRQRMRALLATGAVGLVVCLAFVRLAGPDLALTQLLVEVAATVLVLLALKWLPQKAARDSATPSRWRLTRDGLLATAVGAGAAALAWLMLRMPARPTVADEYLARSMPEAGGPNVVNVIIVDFRGFDTLGEITVLAMAALIVRSLLTGFAPRHAEVPGLARALPSLLLEKVAPLVLPFALLLAVHLFLRGHHLPGGGFVAGLVVALALFLQRVAPPIPGAAPPGLRDVSPLMALGLLLAAGTGLASLWFGAPLLTSAWGVLALPGLGPVPWASVSAFDLGVMGVVVGATLVCLQSILRLSQGR